MKLKQKQYQAKQTSRQNPRVDVGEQDGLSYQCLKVAFFIIYSADFAYFYGGYEDQTKGGEQQYEMKGIQWA